MASGPPPAVDVASVPLLSSRPHPFPSPSLPPSAHPAMAPVAPCSCCSCFCCSENQKGARVRPESGGSFGASTWSQVVNSTCRMHWTVTWTCRIHWKEYLP